MQLALRLPEHDLTVPQGAMRNRVFFSFFLFKGAGRIFLCIIQPHDEPLTTEKRMRQPDAG